MKCEEIGTKRGSRSALASIHSDDANIFMAGEETMHFVLPAFLDFARAQIQANSKLKTLFARHPHKNAHHWPILFGTEWRSDGWHNQDGTLADYFRWWTLENSGGFFFCLFVLVTE